MMMAEIYDMQGVGRMAEEEIFSKWFDQYISIHSIKLAQKSVILITEYLSKEMNILFSGLIELSNL